MRPLRYFVVTYQRRGQYVCWGCHTMEVYWTHRLVLLIEVVDISVQYLDEELY